MDDPLALWYDEHAKFAQLLDLLDSQVAQFHRAELPNYELMRDIVTYLRDFTDRVHHRREEAAFARLSERDRTLQAPLQQLRQEHHVIAAAGEELCRFLEEAAEDVLTPRAAFEAAAATYLAVYRRHLLREENEILPRAACLLTSADWAMVQANVPAPADPLFGPDVHARYQELRRRIAIEAGVLLHP